MSNINIDQIWSGKTDGAPAKLVNPFTDRLKFSVEFSISNDIVQMPNVSILVNYEIIEFRTNAVVLYSPTIYNYNPVLGPYLFAYIAGPTGYDYGFNWTSGDVFGFRASVEAYSYQAPDGDVPVNDVAVSDIFWFRFEDSAGV